MVQPTIYAHFGIRMWIYQVLKTCGMLFKFKTFLIFFIVAVILFILFLLFPIKFRWIPALTGSLLIIIPFFVATVRHVHYSIELTETNFIVRENFATDVTSIAYSTVGSSKFDPKPIISYIIGSGILRIQLKEMENSPSVLEWRVPTKYGTKIALEIGGASAIEHKKG